MSIVLLIFLFLLMADTLEETAQTWKRAYESVVGHLQVLTLKESFAFALRVWHTPHMATHSSKRPKDANQLAKYIVDMSTGQIPKEEPTKERKKNPAAVALGRLGASKGGKARAEKLSEEERKEIAKRAAEARWKKAS